MSTEVPVSADVATTTSVTISNGVPSPDPANITSGQLITFTNSDSVNYLIELWTNGNDHHTAIAVYLAANGGSFQFMSNPGSANGDHCYYNILSESGLSALDSVSPADNTGGNHVIVIGSTGGQ